MQIVAFNDAGNLPAYLTRDDIAKSVNKDIVTAAAFPAISIKGKVFTIVRDGVKTVLRKPDSDDEVAQHVGVVIQRANMNSKVYYGKSFTEDESVGQRPDCYSFDGVAPSSNSLNPQAKKCALCKHNQFGSAVNDKGEAGKGKACSDSARLAVSTPDKIEDAMLLRVPPASLKNLREAVKVINQRKIPYNAVIMKIGFDHESASPKLTFKPVGLIDEATYGTISTELYESENVRAIVGADDVAGDPVEPKRSPAVEVDELDAALAARDASSKAKASAQAAKPEPVKATVSVDDLDELLPPKKAAPQEEPAPKAKAKAKAKAEVEKPAPKSSGAGLLDDLDALLGNADD